MAAEQCSQLSDMDLTAISEQRKRNHRVAKPLRETCASAPFVSAQMVAYKRSLREIPALSRLLYWQIERFQAQRSTFEGKQPTFEGRRPTFEGSECRRGFVALREIPANAFLFSRTVSLASLKQMIDLWGKPTDPWGKKYRPLRELRTTFGGKTTDLRGKKDRPLREVSKRKCLQKCWFHPTAGSRSGFVFLFCNVLINNRGMDLSKDPHAGSYERRQGRMA